MGAHLIFSAVSNKEIQENYHIDQFTASPKIKDILLTPINFDIIYKNDTPHFAKINGHFTISKNNQIIKEYTILPDTLLGNNTRKAVCIEPSSTQNQEFPNIIPCSLNTPFWPGLYQAKITYKINNETKSEEISFFTFPYLLVLGLIIFSLIFYSIVHQYKKRNKI
jgi:hypothetical protein